MQFFFYAGKHFCLRGGEEQRGLSPAQFTRTSNPDGYKYIEHGSKNRSGGLGLLNIENKCVPCVALQENRPRCLVFLLDLYLSKLPKFAFDKGIFYCRPKQNCPSQGSWYDAVAVGKNKLSSLLQEICEESRDRKKKQPLSSSNRSHCIISEQCSFIPNPKNNWTSIREGTPAL